ncbi:MAG: hypothetical protein ABQ298_00215 [Puniceicoccaceae bacterium]
MKFWGTRSRTFLLALGISAGWILSAETQTSTVRFTFPDASDKGESAAVEILSPPEVQSDAPERSTSMPMAQSSRVWLGSDSELPSQWKISADWDRSLANIRNLHDLAHSPYHKTDTFELRGRYETPLSDSISAFSEAGLSLQSGTTATLTNGHSLIATTGASIAVSPKLKFSIGMLTNKHFLGSVRSMPIIGLDWDITDRLTLRTLNGAFLSYELNRSTEIDLSLQYFDDSFAVENLQGTVFMRMDQPLLLEESSLVGTFGVRHNWKDVFSIRAFAEFVGSRDLRAPSLSDGVDSVELPSTDDQRLSFGVEGGIRF